MYKKRTAYNQVIEVSFLQNLAPTYIFHLIQVDEIFSTCGALNILSSVHILFPTWNRNPIFVFPVLFSLSFYYLPLMFLVIICFFQGAFSDYLNLNYTLIYNSEILQY